MSEKVCLETHIQISLRLSVSIGSRIVYQCINFAVSTKYDFGKFSNRIKAAEIKRMDKDSLTCMHITSLSVLRTHRKCGIATALMRRSQLEMEEVFEAEYVSLHVRESNRAAIHLYNKTLQYEINDVEKGYYADGEDAYDMRCTFKKNKKQDCVKEITKGMEKQVKVSA